jgi:hypothetical protein
MMMMIYSRWENIIKKKLKEVGFVDKDWIHVARQRGGFL